MVQLAEKRSKMKAVRGVCEVGSSSEGEACRDAGERGDGKGCPDGAGGGSCQRWKTLSMESGDIDMRAYSELEVGRCWGDDDYFLSCRADVKRLAAGTRERDAGWTLSALSLGSEFLPSHHSIVNNSPEELRYQRRVT